MTDQIEEDYYSHGPFLPWSKSRYKEVDRVVGILTDEVASVLSRRIERSKLKNHVERIILRLYIEAMANPLKWSDYPRREQAFRKGTRLNRVGLRHDTFIGCVDALHDLGYIDHRLGRRDLGLQSSMRAKASLIEAIKGGKVEPAMILNDHEPIYFRQKDKTYIDVPESRRRKQMANRIVALNKLLDASEVRFDLTDEQRLQYVALAKHLPNMHYRTMYRTFNRVTPETWQLLFGGRFYGHAVQGIKSWWRQFVRINGEPVRELDYGGMHIRLLYAKAGAVPPPGDVYDIGLNEVEAGLFERTWGVELRAVLKKLLLIGINAKTDKATVEATLGDLTDSDDDPDSIWLDDDRRKEFGKVLWGLLKKLKDRHPAIAKFICKDQGIKLQRLDSDIADMILAEFVRRGKPIIPIHDSFLVREQDRDFLWVMMERAWREYVPGVEPVIEDKIGKWNPDVVGETESPCWLNVQTASQMEENTVEWDMGLVG